MKKYEVNYKRSFPEHRLDFDYKYYQSIKTSPLEQLKVRHNKNVDMEVRL